ncbi:serine/threonine-protein phosphatase [Dactylosporangium vinaceum]|uniref:PP2C family protein-serine/threonine phosphatase n=1 Tax=Dactylosporangium vinaceum TaxID=53362 RepID=A0ABV5MDY8_9ACTN|nr:PP2C family protein-serine/threonine phosphatase [Dactylosporangium vinaceum]UAC01185.1 serine/threonine-protein phosphatase [Dactylosporangium vinaceum]
MSPSVNEPWPWRAAVADLLQRTRLAQPDELAGEVSAAAAPLGLAARIYLVDQEQRNLHPVPQPEVATPEPLAVNSTAAGRVFMTVQGVTEGSNVWLPLLDGSERLGVLHLAAGGAPVPPDESFQAGCDLFSQLVGHMVATKIPYGDALLKVKRTRRMSEASELLFRLLPPLTFVSRRMVVSAILEPCYEVGGDGFDYASDDSTLFFAIYDTAGHGLRAGLGTATVMSAVRSARRGGDDLVGLARAADRALAAYLPELRFTTAVLCELDVAGGRLRYVNCGHPRPLLLRGGKVVASLDDGRRLPLGLDDPGTEVGEEVLERGDRLLLYTDGVTETRERGEQFGIDALADLLERTTGDLPAPEALRRLCHAALSRYDGPPTDDATLMLVEWSHEAVRAMVPTA